MCGGSSGGSGHGGAVENLASAALYCLLLFFLHGAVAAFAIVCTKRLFASAKVAVDIPDEKDADQQPGSTFTDGGKGKAIKAPVGKVVVLDAGGKELNVAEAMM